MTRNFSPGGVPGEDVAAYYRRRAEGGTGLLITEGVGIDHPAALGRCGPRRKQPAAPPWRGGAGRLEARRRCGACRRRADRAAALAPGRDARARDRSASGGGIAASLGPVGAGGPHDLDRPGLCRTRAGADAADERERDPGRDRCLRAQRPPRARGRLRRHRDPRRARLPDRHLPVGRDQPPQPTPGAATGAPARASPPRWCARSGARRARRCRSSSASRSGSSRTSRPAWRRRRRSSRRCSARSPMPASTCSTAACAISTAPSSRARRSTSRAGPASSPASWRWRSAASGWTAASTIRSATAAPAAPTTSHC